MVRPTTLPAEVKRAPDESARRPSIRILYERGKKWVWGEGPPPSRARQVRVPQSPGESYFKRKAFPDNFRMTNQDLTVRRAGRSEVAWGAAGIQTAGSLRIEAFGERGSG